MPKLTEPEKARILRDAETTVSLLKALAKEPDFCPDISTISPSAAGLAYLADFVVNTLRQYWTVLLPAEKMAEFVASPEQFNGVSHEDKIKEVQDWFGSSKERVPNFDISAWPLYDREKLSDSIGRNILAAMIVQDPGKQAMMGGEYTYSNEVKDVCNTTTSRAES